MKWKLVLALIVIFAIIFFLFFTPYFKQYTGFFGLNADFGYLVGSFLRTQPLIADKFDIELTASTDNLAGLGFKISNSSLEVKGTYSYLKIDGGNENFPTGYLEIKLDNFSGAIDFLSADSIKISADASSVSVNGVQRNREKPYKVEFEIVPLELEVFNLKLDKLVLTVDGQLKRMIGDKTDTVNLSGDRIEVKPYTGALALGMGTYIFSGKANSVVGQNFDFK